MSVKASGALSLRGWIALERRWFWVRFESNMRIRSPKYAFVAAFELAKSINRNTSKLKVGGA
jgi:hypothetical protein